MIILSCTVPASCLIYRCLFLLVVQYHPAPAHSVIYYSINREGLTEQQQQNAVEEQIAAASMEQINYRVGGFPVAPCGCRMLYVADRLLTTTLPTWPCSCCFICISFCLFVLLLLLFYFRLRMVERHASICQPSLDTLAC